MKRLKLPTPRPRVSIDERRRRILAEVSVGGFFIPKGHPPIKNKFTRNFAYVIDGLIRKASVTVYDEGGTGRTMATSDGSLAWATSAANEMQVPVFVQYGIGYTTPTITDNNLASPDLHIPTNYIDVVEEADSTTIVCAGRWSPDASKEYREVGLKLFTDIAANYVTLLARTVFPSALPRSAFTIYFEGYAVKFPSNFTRWFVRALAFCASGLRKRNARGVPCIAQDGSPFSLQVPQAFAGAPDVMIGSNNAPPSPTDYNLKAPIASLANQAQTVEIDTALQEARIVRYGTYTPSTNVTLGEIGLFANLNGFVAGSLAGRKTLLVRVALDTPVTLVPGTTYTLGIVIRLA